MLIDAPPALNMLTVQLAAVLKDTIRLALLREDGPTGGFFSAGRQEPW